MTAARALLVLGVAAGLTAAPPVAAHAAPLAPAVRIPRIAPDTLSDAELDQETAQLAAQLRCPVCRNQSVLESSAELSQQMRREIRQRLAAGDTPAQVKAYFVSRYGEYILLTPPATGVNWLVYVLPVLFVTLGGWYVVRRLRRWSADRAGAAPERRPSAELEGPFSDEERRWLDAEIRGERGPEHR